MSALSFFLAFFTKPAIQNRILIMKPSIPKGTRDFSPEVVIRREYIFSTIRKVFRKFGYQPIETPTMENLSVLTGKYGEEGDRLIFKVLNSGEYLKSLDLNEYAGMENPEAKMTPEICGKALRYDLTVPFARYVVMNFHELTLPFKRYQIQRVWRADKPQKGRYREFYQCDADVVGSDSLIYEAELAAIYDEALSNLGLKNFTIHLNNRKILEGIAEAAGAPDKFVDICVSIDKLDKIGKDGVAKELNNRGIDEDAASTIFEIIGFEGDNIAKLAFLKEKLAGSEIGATGVAEMEEVFDILSHFTLQNGTIDLDIKLARGLNYYTGTIYEVSADDVEIGSIGGGGRYADLTGLFGRPGLSGVGVSFGADRIYDVMEQLELFADLPVNSTRVMIVNFGPNTLSAGLKALNGLRNANIPAEIFHKKTKMGKQFGYADKKNVPFVLVIGEDEIKNNTFVLKEMKTGDQETLSWAALLDRLKL